MNCPKEWGLNLNGDTFNAMKSDFNAILRKTLTNMESKNSELAEITVKVKISLKKDQDSIGEQLPRDIVVPKFDHKVSSVMQIKDELTGSLGGNYELVWDGERGEYVMREIIDRQQNLFNQEAIYVDAEVVDDGSSLPDNRADDKTNDGLPTLTGGPKMLSTGNSVSIRRQECSVAFPECICLDCKTFGGTCCAEHARDCKDTTDCIDREIVVEDDGDDSNDGYRYEEPKEDIGDE